MPKNCWVKKPMKKKGVSGVLATPINKKPIVHYDKIIFDNVPSFVHLASQDDRMRALRQHRMWEEQLECQPLGDLQRMFMGTITQLPRQTLCYLIARYCIKQYITHEALLRTIATGGGNTTTNGLVTSSGDASVVNLHVLSNAVLWYVYTSIPNEYRPTPRPVPPRKTGRGKRKIAAAAAAALPVAQPYIIEEAVVWSCCDKCGKWRRVPGVQDESELPTTWFCYLHPDDIECDDPEETMDNDEKWNGNTSGVQNKKFDASQSLPEPVESSGPETTASSAQTSSFVQDDKVVEIDNESKVENLFGEDYDDGDGCGW